MTGWPSRMAPLAAAAVLAGCAGTRSGADAVEALAGRMEGVYDNRVQFERQPPGAEPAFSRLGLVRRRVDVPALGEHVVYSQINRNADPGDVYRQRLLVLERGADGVIRGTNWSFADPEAQRDVGGRLEDLATLPAEAFVRSLPPGCEMGWRRDGERFEGRVDPAACIIVSARDGRRRRIGATEFVEPGRIRNEEGGYTDAGAQIFGLPDGVYYEYERVAP